MNNIIKSLDDLTKNLRSISCEKKWLQDFTNNINAFGEQTLFVDRLFEEIIIKHFQNVCGIKELYCEESGHIVLKEEGYSIIIDPLDGSQNFRMNLPYYSYTVAALDEENNLLAAYVANLVTGKSYSAIKGNGAEYNGVPIHVDKKLNFEDTHAIFVGLSKEIEILDYYNRIITKVKSYRAMGCASLDLCCVALGRCGLFIDLSNSAKYMDVLASSLIIEEAGGIVVTSSLDNISTLLKGKKNIAHSIFNDRLNIIAAANEDIFNLSQDLKNKNFLRGF
jgi:myo-inositol-1(or 4)-monophosphatase